MLERTIASGEELVAAAAGTSDGVGAIRAYMHAALDHGIGVVNIVHALIDDTDWPDLTTRAEVLMGELIDRGRRDDRLDDGFDVGDIVFATIRFGRPLAIGLSPAADRANAHRQLDRYLDGWIAEAHTAAREEPRT